MQLEVQQNIYEQPQRAEFEVPWEHIGYSYETHRTRKGLAKLLAVTINPEHYSIPTVLRYLFLAYKPSPAP